MRFLRWVWAVPAALVIVSPALGQADISQVKPDELAAVKADIGLSAQVSRCAGAYAVLARRAENLGEEDEMVAHRQDAVYWIAILNELFTEKWAEPRMNRALEYWKRVIQRDGEENSYFMLLAQDLTCGRFKDRLEGVESSP